jgi:hypothetical protein
MSRSPQLSLSFRFPYQNPVHTSPLPLTLHMPSLSHSSRFYHKQNVPPKTHDRKFGRLYMQTDGSL